MSSATPKSMLEQISTCWPMIHNPVQFVMRYARAIHKYGAAIVRDPHEAEEVAQNFLVKVLDQGFCPENVSRGRFRDYLKAAVRYVAIGHLRKRRPEQLSENDLASLAQESPEAEQEWQQQWRDCLLERVWQGLETFQSHKQGNIYYLVLRQFTTQPEESSAAHAERLSQSLRKPIRPDAFRQLLHRARRQFAILLIEEVRRTLQTPTAEAVELELIDLELMSYVRDFLPKKE